MRKIMVVFLALLLLATPLAVAHKSNHEMQHQACDVMWMTPHGHGPDDGHRHEHDPDIAGPEHKDLHNHDPCNQSRMTYPDYESVAPITEIDPPTKELDPEEIIWNDNDATNSEVYIGGEAYQFPIAPGTFQEIDSLVISSNADAAALAAAGVISGTGDEDDPYVIQNLIVGRALIISDTDKCFVVKNNIVVDRVVEAPIVPDPDDLINVTKLIRELIELIDGLLADIAEYLGITEELEAARALWDENATIWENEKLVWDAEAAAKQAQLANMNARSASYDAQLAQWQQDIANYEGNYLNSIGITEQLASDFEYYMEQILGFDPTTVTQPTKSHQQFINNGQVVDIGALQDSFESYQDDASKLIGAVSETGQNPSETNFDVRDMIDENPPGATPPAGYSGSDWSSDLAQYDDYRQWILDEVTSYWGTLKADEPDYDGFAAFMEEYNGFQEEYAAFMGEYNSFTASHTAFQNDFNAFMDDYSSFLASNAASLDEYNALIADAEADIADAEALIDTVQGFAWKLGDLLFETIDQVLEHLLTLIFGLIDPHDPHEVANNNGQLVLDWNGQCLHVYNNVINDLRVNQNNDRTGFATGGILENNRIFTIGQIRHYDGIFRDNEVGNRAHLYSLIDPNITAPTNDQSVNNDGANQGWYFDNVIYGQVDLDFHGHHHSAGFFAPESHFHGSVYREAYMVNTDGSCKFTHDDLMPMPGHHQMHESDNDFEVLGETIIDGPDNEPCLPHHDHGKRWTSVFFNDNVIIDPNGLGLRFEDENHRADDEQANSENMRELKKPHFHQKWVQVENNTVVGKIFIDVLNAKGTFLWSDDWSEVENTAGIERSIEALDHPGARIAYSHPMRNDAWLDIQNNTVLQTQSVGVLVSDAEFMTKLQLNNNRAVGAPTSISGYSFEALRDWLWNARYASAASIADDVDDMGSGDRGVQNFVLVRNAIDKFNVVFCGNTLHRLDGSLVATDRIYQDGASTIDYDCTSDNDDDGLKANELGTAASPLVAWVPAPDRARFTDGLRELTHDTDSFYLLELAFDMADALLPAHPEDALPVET